MSLFIGLILVLIGTKVKLCLSFGLILFGIGAFLYSWHKTEQSNEIQKEVALELQNYDVDKQEDKAIVNELKRIQKEDKKSSRRIVVCFVLFGAMMVILGLVSCF